MTWPLTRLDRFAQSWPSSVDKHWQDGERPVRLCNYTDVYKNDAITPDLDFMAATASPDEIERFRIRRGDTLITKDSETADDIGVPAFVQYEAPDLVCGYHLSIVRPDETVSDPRFVYWALASDFVAGQWAVLASGVTRVGLRRSDIARVSVPAPPLPEQRAIADYLDRETAQIDALIAKQRQLGERLAERRRALITRLALDGFTPLSKSSSDSVPVGAQFTVVLGKMLDAGRRPAADDLDLPYVRAANIADSGLDLTDVNSMPFTERERRDLSLRRNDLLVVEGGSVGTSVLLTEDMPGWSFQKTVNRVRSRDDASTAWLGYVLRSYRDTGVIDIVCLGSTIAHFTAEKLRALRVPLLSAKRQCEIVAELDARTAEIDQMVEKAERFIALAKERRAALITAAVTGQLDVRTAA